MSIEKPFVFVHIEKTAGTSLGKQFRETFDDERNLRYDAKADTVIRQSDRTVGSGESLPYRVGRQIMDYERFPRVAAAVVGLGHMAVKNLDRWHQSSPEKMPRDFDILHGHFAADRFTDILSPDEHDYTTVLREPMARMRSHYEHWARTGGIHHFRARPAYDPEMQFEDFAMLPEMRNYQSQAVAIPTEQYRAIGVVDHLQEFAESLGWTQPENAVPHVNVGRYAMEQTVDPGFMRDFQEQHEADYELYEAIYDQWHA